MLMPDAEIAQAGRRLDPALELRKEPRGLIAHAAMVEKAKAPMRLTRKNVLSDGEIVEHHRFLMNDADAELRGFLRRGDDDRRAIENDRAAVRRVHARQNLHQRRFAGAVLADQRGDRAGAELE